MLPALYQLSVPLSSSLLSHVSDLPCKRRLAQISYVSTYLYISPALVLCFIKEVFYLVIPHSTDTEAEGKNCGKSANTSWSCPEQN